MANFLERSLAPRPVSSPSVGLRSGPQSGVDYFGDIGQRTSASLRRPPPPAARRMAPRPTPAQERAQMPQRATAVDPGFSRPSASDQEAPGAGMRNVDTRVPESGGFTHSLEGKEGAENNALAKAVRTGLRIGAPFHPALASMNALATAADKKDITRMAPAVLGVMGAPAAVASLGIPTARNVVKSLNDDSTDNPTLGDFAAPVARYAINKVAPEATRALSLAQTLGLTSPADGTPSAPAAEGVSVTTKKAIAQREAAAEQAAAEQAAAQQAAAQQAAAQQAAAQREASAQGSAPSGASDSGTRGPSSTGSRAVSDADYSGSVGNTNLGGDLGVPGSLSAGSFGGFNVGRAMADASAATNGWGRGTGGQRGRGGFGGGIGQSGGDASGMGRNTAADGGMATNNGFSRPGINAAPSAMGSSMLSMGFNDGGMVPMGVPMGPEPSETDVQTRVQQILRDSNATQRIIARPLALMQSGELTPDEVLTMGRVAEAAMFNPALYPQLRAFVAQQGMTPLPPSYDPSVITNIMVISKALQAQMPATPPGQVPGMGQAQVEQPVPGFGNGGYIRGPGTGRSDSIGTVNETSQAPVKVATDEYIIPAHVVRAKGRDFFDNLLRRYQPMGGQNQE